MALLMHTYSMQYLTAWCCRKHVSLCSNKYVSEEGSAAEARGQLGGAMKNKPTRGTLCVVWMSDRWIAV